MGSASGTPAQGGLPPWAVVSSDRAAHVARVVALLDAWAVAAAIAVEERERWLRAGWLHDALRDAPEAALRATLPASDDPLPLLHGPAAAVRAAAEGETDHDVLEAVRWHTVGHAQWGRTGRALYAADFLEPGRPFAQAERAALAAAFPTDPQRVLVEVVTMRAAHQQGRGRRDHPMSAAFRAALGS
jgi:HD superfamily phosphohydrolase YqeK